MKKNPIPSIALASVLLATAAPAGPLVYEPFNYSVGSLTGQNGGIGFASGWQKAAADVGGYVWDQTTNLQYGAQTPALIWNGVLNNGLPTLPATGARYGGADPAQPPTGSSNLGIYRNLSSSAGALAGPDGILWMSAVYHVVNTGLGGGVHIGLGSGHIYERGRIFPTTTTDFVGASGYTGASNIWSAGELRAVVVDDSNGPAVGWTDFSRSATGLALNTTKDMIVVLKFTFSPTSDTVDAFFFDEDTALASITEAAFDAGKVSTTFATGIDENSLTVLSMANGRFANAYDEIRIGDTLNDVITLPAPGPVDAGMSIVSASPGVAPADGITPSTITVTLTDIIGIPIQGKDVSLANTSGPLAATISPAGTQTTNSSGQATFTVKSATAGTEVFTATNVTDSLVITQTASVTFVSSADAALSTVVAAPTLVGANGTATSTITVTLKATGDVPVPGKQVTLAGSPANAVIAPATPVTTNASGVATFTVSSTTPGTVVFTATDVSDSNLVITQTASVNFFGPGNAGLSTVAASHASVVANGTTAATITVSLKDANGFAVQGKDISLAGSPGTAVIAPASAVTNVSGVATFSVSSSTAGTVVFTATDTTDAVVITQTASVNFVNAATPLTIHYNVFNSAGTPVLDDPATLEGPAGGLGATWNQSNVVAASNLLSSTGVLTGVGISCNGDGRWPIGNAADTLKLLRAGAAHFDSTTPHIVTISGLTPDSFFDVFLASARTDGVETNNGTWATANETLSSNSQPVSNVGNINGTSWVAGNNYVAFQKVKVNGSGQIVFTGTPNGIRLFLNGLQLVPTTPPFALITSFGIPGYPGVIDQTAKTISLSVPGGTNLATLAPEFTLFSGTCNQTSGLPPSPTFASANPATYTVTDTSTDPDTVNSYSVTVIVPPPTATLVIDLGTSPIGTTIEGGSFLGSGVTNLPLPTLPVGSILRSIAVNTKLEATNNDNFASDLSVLLDPTPGTPGGDFSVEITNGTTPLGGTALDLNWPSAADAGVGTLLTDVKTDTNWAAAAPIDLATTGLFLGNAFQNGGWVSPQGATWSGTITLTYDLVGTGTKYEDWANGELFENDKNGDGVKNGLAFLLGAANPNENALGRIPAPSKTATGLKLNFSVLKAADRGAAAVIVQWSNDLGLTDPWSANVAAVPPSTSVVNGVDFQVDSSGALDVIQATIPSTEAAAGKLFGRLSGEEN